MVKAILPIGKGDLITAKRLNEYGSSINKINKVSVDPPKQTDGEQPDPATQTAAAEEEAGETESSTAFIETSRQTVQVQVFDQDQVNYALIDRVEKITFANALGETLTLEFNN